MLVAIIVRFLSGAVHEHTRPDRDLFVKILWENIQHGQEQNFHKVTSDAHNTSNTPFDYESIMMYGPSDFGTEQSLGKRKNTIQPHESGVDIRYIFLPTM